MSVRIRPLNEAEAERGAAWKLEGNTVVPLHARGGEAAEACYNLDNVFDSAWTTERVYRHTTGDIVGKVVGGFNGARRSPPQHQLRCAWLRLRARTGSCGSALRVWQAASRGAAMPRARTPQLAPGVRKSTL